MGHFAILGAEDVLMSDQLSLCLNLTTLQQGTLLALAAKDTPRTDPSTVFCVLLRGTYLRRTPTHYIRSAHQCAGRAVYFAAAKYGKAGRPPGGATLVAVRGLVPPK